MSRNLADQIYRDLLRDLRAGRHQPGAALPSLRALAASYRCATGSVRAALQRLQAEGQVRSEHGRGYFATADAGTRPLAVLLIARTEGDTWTQYFRMFCQKLAALPDISMIVAEAPMPPESPDRGVFRRKVERLVEAGLDAIIFDGNYELHLEFLRRYESRLRLICYNMDDACRDWNCARITSDFFHGGYAGARHLLDQGASHIMYLVPHSYGQPWAEPQRRVLEGCRQALADTPRAASVQRLALNAHELPFTQQVEAWLDAHPEVDAIFSYCDFRFEHIVPMLKRRGLRLPQDMCLLGYFDTPWCQTLDPPLSSIDIRPERIVDEVVRVLLSGSMDPVMVRPGVVARASSLRHSPAAKPEAAVSH